jgi:hypothetical protein
MGSTSSDHPVDLFAAAQQLRTVRVACRRFLMLWAMSPSKRLANESTSASRQNLSAGSGHDDPEALLRAISDPENRDWSFLYRGDVLDD